MSTYEEDDHNITTPRNGQTRPPAAPGARQHQTLAAVLDSFFHAESEPGVAADPRERFLDALRAMNTAEGSAMALELLESLNAEPEGHGDTRGVPQEMIDSLERVPLDKVPNRDTADCPICTNRFVDDEYPLLVKLPCKVQHRSATSKDHVFDLECIGPWLKVNSTCPICRFDILAADKQRRQNLDEELRKAREEDSEDEEQDWDVYG